MEKKEIEKTQEAQSSADHLYLIRAKDKIKIGITSDVEKRLQQLQTSNPEKLELLGYLYIKGWDVRKIEQELHHFFSWRNVTGEWFAIHENEAFLALKRLFCEKVLATRENILQDITKRIITTPGDIPNLIHDLYKNDQALHEMIQQYRTDYVEWENRWIQSYNIAKRVDYTIDRQEKSLKALWIVVIVLGMAFSFAVGFMQKLSWLF